MNLLLLSSSREGNTEYLAHAQQMISDHLGTVKHLLFIPYAGVSISYDTYTNMVQSALEPLGIKVTSIHQVTDAKKAIEEADAIAVGGGNTFHLLHQLYEGNLIEIMQKVVASGTPYIGWSAGSNIAGASIRTTNDMPIIEPKSFNALNFVPFQLNPHYTDYQPPGHNGETRQMRIEEFMVLNPSTTIVGIQEGSALKRTGDTLTLIGDKVGYSFLAGEKSEIAIDSDLSRLLTQ